MPAETTSYYEKQGPSFASSTQENLRPVQDVTDYLKQYARENPEQAALWIFGIGFVLGWKLKPW